MLYINFTQSPSCPAQGQDRKEAFHANHRGNPPAAAGIGPPGTGVSGDEGGIAKKIEELLRPAADCRRTPLGNVIAVQNAGAPKKLMTAAHMDEVGFLVTHIEEDGFRG